MAKAKPSGAANTMSLEEMSAEITRLSAKLSELEMKPPIRVSREKVLEILYGVFLNADSLPQDLRTAMSNWMATAIRSHMTNPAMVTTMVETLKQIASAHSSQIGDQALSQKIATLMASMTFEASRISRLREHVQTAIRALIENGNVRLTA